MTDALQLAPGTEADDAQEFLDSALSQLRHAGYGVIADNVLGYDNEIRNLWIGKLRVKKLFAHDE
jgi:hypothetical protein